MNYSDQSIKVLTGWKLARHLWRIGDHEALFTTSAIYGVIEEIERCSKFYQENRELIKKSKTVAGVDQKELNEIEDSGIFELHIWADNKWNNWYVKQHFVDKPFEITEMMVNNCKIITRKLQCLERARSNFWRVYNETDLGYSLDERDYLSSSESYRASYVSENAKGELDSDEIRDSEDKSHNLQGLGISHSRELTEEEQEEHEREEEAWQIEQTKQLEEEDRKERELIFDDEVDLEAQDSVKEIQTLREEFLKTEEEDKRQEILSKAQELADEYFDKLIEEDEEENKKYWKENPEEDEDDDEEDEEE